MKYAEAEKMLKSCGQEHVLAYWKKLNKSQREGLLAQVSTIDPKSVQRCVAALRCGADVPDSSKGKAPKVAVLKGNAYRKAYEVGMEELRAGRVAVLLVAGGQGSRLGFDGPKGAFPIGPVSDYPLFYFHARKILGWTLRTKVSLPWYIMTSEINNDATVACFKQYDYFGLDPKDVFFFTQGQWPGMTKDGKIILDRPDHVFMSPDGHGGLLAALRRSGALDDMKKRGIKSVFFFQVDNPLVQIADPAFIGYHILNDSEYSLKLCAKRDPYEKVGMPMQFGSSYRMVEYTEMTDEQCNRKDKKGNLYFRYGSPAIHVFDRAFLAREADKAMPLHLAFKKIPFVDEKEKVVKPTEPNGYKFEKFIFDILPHARHAAFLAFDQKDEFSPVKNAEGKDSPATCKADLRAKWLRWLESVGISVKKDIPIELDPAIYLEPFDIENIGLFLSAGV